MHTGFTRTTPGRDVYPRIVYGSHTALFVELLSVPIGLGLGTRPPDPSWGSMLQLAQRYLNTEGMLAVWPGLAIMITVLAFNLLGDTLRDLLGPRLRGAV
jgi:ABC-type dipeptide/oligopeptide/nickel transport system permease subunit